MTLSHRPLVRSRARDSDAWISRHPTPGAEGPGPGFRFFEAIDVHEDRQKTRGSLPELAAVRRAMILLLQRHDGHRSLSGHPFVLMRFLNLTDKDMLGELRWH